MWVKLFIFDTLKLGLAVAMNKAVKRVFPVHLWRPACRQRDLPVKQFEKEVGASLSDQAVHYIEQGEEIMIHLWKLFLFLSEGLNFRGLWPFAYCYVSSYHQNAPIMPRKHELDKLKPTNCILVYFTCVYPECLHD